ncbi:MAG: sigma-70 family RNA polymerase sigma factor [Kiritimatiellae bacterium]|nr:sigma-70 family RNA polymerase sigma factor [Kiritimatiellia bacterium]
MNTPDISKLPSVNPLHAGDDRDWDDFLTSFDGVIRAIVAWPKWHFDFHTQEDVIQTIKVGIIQSLDRLQSKGALQAFVRKICVNRCIDMLRKKLREQNRLVPLGNWNEDGEWEEVDVATGAEFDPVAILQRSERAALLLKALARLDAPCQSLIREFYMNGVSYRELAQRHNISVNTVGSRLSRCLDKLREVLQQEGDPR